MMWKKNKNKKKKDDQCQAQAYLNIDIHEKSRVRTFRAFITAPFSESPTHIRAWTRPYFFLVGF
jgi:hypothetical protein